MFWNFVVPLVASQFVSRNKLHFPVDFEMFTVLWVVGVSFELKNAHWQFAKICQTLGLWTPTWASWSLFWMMQVSTSSGTSVNSGPGTKMIQTNQLFYVIAWNDDWTNNTFQINKNVAYHYSIRFNKIEKKQLSLFSVFLFDWMDFHKANINWLFVRLWTPPETVECFLEDLPSNLRNRITRAWSWSTCRHIWLYLNWIQFIFCIWIPTKYQINTANTHPKRHS